MIFVLFFKNLLPLPVIAKKSRRYRIAATLHLFDCITDICTWFIFSSYYYIVVMVITSYSPFVVGFNEVNEINEINEVCCCFSWRM